MKKLLLGISLGIIALASIASVYAYANGNLQTCGFSAGCTGTNVTSTTTSRQGNQTIVQGLIVFHFTQTVTVAGTVTTSTTTINYSCPTTETTVDQYGNQVVC